MPKAKEFSSENSFHEFQDTPVSDTEYGGTAQQQIDFFRNNSNAFDIIDKIDKDQEMAFITWSQGKFMDGRQYEGWDAMDKISKDYTQTYDDILDKATLSKGLTVRRLTDAQLFLGKGNKTPSLEALNALKGSVITSKTNLSFSAAGQGLKVDGTKNVEIKMHIPPGTQGAGMWIGHDKINFWGAKQREYMSNRDSLFKVGKTTYDAKRDVYVVEVTHMGHTAHDYGTTGRLNKYTFTSRVVDRKRTSRT